MQNDAMFLHDRICFEGLGEFNWKPNQSWQVVGKHFNWNLTRYATLKNELFSIFQLVEGCIMRQM